MQLPLHFHGQEGQCWLVTRSGHESLQTCAGIWGTGCSGGFARLSQHHSCSQLCSDCSDDGTGMPVCQRDALALQH